MSEGGVDWVYFFAVSSNGDLITQLEDCPRLIAANNEVGDGPGEAPADLHFINRAVGNYHFSYIVLVEVEPVFLELGCRVEDGLKTTEQQNKLTLQRRSPELTKPSCSS